MRTFIRTVTPFRAALVYLAALACLAAPVAAGTQEPYPARPIRLIIPFPPAGMGDNTARMLVTKWGESLKQQIVIENRAGAASNIGIDAVAKAAPDGYTIGLFDTAMVVNPSLYAKLPYDAQRDLQPIMIVARGPLVLTANPSLPAAGVKELIALARAKPGALSYGSAGSGTAIHLAAEMFKAAANVDIVHVPYKGVAPAMVDAIGGQVQLLFALPGTARAHIAAGKLRAIALTGARRFKGLPNTPTFAESGVPGVDATLIVGFMAPARTPAAIVKLLHDTLAGVVAQADIVERLGEQALDVVASDPARSSDILRVEQALWARVVKSSGATAE